jgi:hypothetical protein
MKKTIFLFTAILIAFVACHRVHDAVSTKADPKVDYSTEGYIKAIVTDVQLDGCRYMLKPDESDKKLEPQELAKEFQVDSLKVWVKYEVEDRMSVCMAGQTVRVIDIRKR